MTEKTERNEKKINVEQVVTYLKHAFSKAAAKSSSQIGTRALRTATRGRVETTVLYDYQVGFTYLVDAIQRGPVYMVPKLIQDANDLIASLEKEQGE